MTKREFIYIFLVCASGDLWLNGHKSFLIAKVNENENENEITLCLQRIQQWKSVDEFLTNAAVVRFFRAFGKQVWTHTV